MYTTSYASTVGSNSFQHAYNNAMKPRVACIAAALSVLLCGSGAAWSGVQSGERPRLPAPSPESQPAASNPDPRAELETGAELTAHGYLQRAIPHLLAARAAGIDA